MNELEPPDVLARFLLSLGRRSESEFYLDLFRAQEKERFAAICVDGPVVKYALDVVALDLRFLSVLGLFPSVVLGVFDPAEANAHATDLRERLERAGVAARILPPDDSAAIATAAREGALPILALSQGARARSADRIQQLGALVSALRTRKLIFLQRRGGLVAGGRLLSIVNVNRDADGLEQSRDLSSKQRILVAEGRKILCDPNAHPMTVSITSPFDLLRELFTTKGAGTLLRRDAVVERHAGAAGIAVIDWARMRALLTSAFGKPVAPTFAPESVSTVYVETGYRGAALFVDTPIGGYLSKFAVERDAQGEGIGGDLWERMIVDYPTFFWRSRPSNPINAWYTQRCDGLVRLPEWHVFFRGLSAERIPHAIALAEAQPRDFVDPSA